MPLLKFQLYSTSEALTDVTTSDVDDDQVLPNLRKQIKIQNRIKNMGSKKFIRLTKKKKINK